MIQSVATINGIDLKVKNLKEEEVYPLEYKNLTKEIKVRILQKRKEIKESKDTLSRFVSPIKPQIIIKKELYFKLVKQKKINKQRDIGIRQYIDYLFHTISKEELKDVARQFELRGYSKFNRSDLIEFLLDSLSEEEKHTFVIENEKDIISKEIAIALKILNGDYKESIEKIKVINPDIHEIELYFKGFEWTTTSYIIINENTISNPERDCDCNKGVGMGFCPHFWIGFMYSYKKKYFDLSDWTLTYLPEEFKKQLKKEKIYRKL